MNRAAQNRAKAARWPKSFWLTFAMLTALLALAPLFVKADSFPTQGLLNYENPHVHPIDLTPNGDRLLAVNTAAGTLEVFDVAGSQIIPIATIPVGLDPVSVRARSDTQAWVVNHISDSVSVVDLNIMTVIATLDTDNEPADVVFAGSPERAFVSCSEANAIQVFDPNNLNAAPEVVDIHGEDPRALAVSNDGQRVFAAIFESGNGTTALGGGGSIAGNVVSRPEGPYGGQNPPPNDGNQFNPPIASGLPAPPGVAMIVRKDAQSRWMDDNNGDWSIFVSGALASASGRVPGWDLLDHDVAIIDTDTLAVEYQTRLMNMVMAIDVNPASGEVSVVGTDATNEVRFEPNLNGRFLRVNVASFAPGGSADIDDLNPHLDYSSSTVSQSLRTQSVGDPRGIAWNAAGSQAFVTGMGSNNVVVINAQGARVDDFSVGEGPTGIVLDDAANRGFVLNKFAGSISMISLSGRTQIAQLAFADPTPQVIKDGRALLYDTHLTSGLGHVSCASCHVDGRTDRLSWDLGDPQGSLDSVPNGNNSNGDFTGTFNTVHPMKGPMLTQSLQDIIAHPIMHWRGDRNSLAEFNPAFVSLLGADNEISTAQMQAFEDFLDTIHLPPNPYRNLDDSRPTSVTLPDGSVATSPTLNALRGGTSSNDCLGCHTNGLTRNEAANSELGQSFVAPGFAPFYDRLGYFGNLATGSTSGFGFFHDGADLLGNAVRTITAESQDDFLAEILMLEGPSGPLAGGETRQDTHAGVGAQITFNGAGSGAQNALLNEFMSIANASPHAAIIAKGRVAGVSRGFFGDGGVFQSDRAAEQRSLSELLSFAAAGEPITFTLVAQGTEQRFGVDANGNGVFDGDENTLPEVTDPGTQRTNLGQGVTLLLEATDAEGSALTFSANGLPPGLSIELSTGRISGTPSAIGIFTVTVTATDALGGVGTATFDWQVPDASGNFPPLLTNPGTQQSGFGQSVSLQLSATDADGDTLAFSASGLPSGLSIDANSGLIFGQSSVTQSTTVTVTVQDGNGGSASESFSWDVLDGPVVLNPGAQIVARGESVSVSLQASGSGLSFAADGLPDGLSINAGNGVISGTATVAGTFAVSVTVTDDLNLQSTVSFAWLVAVGGAQTAFPEYTGGNTGLGNFSLGYVLRANEDVSVSALGVFDGNGNGVLDAQTNVGLWTISGQLLAQAVVPVGTPLLGDSFFADITPINLNAGQNYVVAYRSTGSGEPFQYQGTMTSAGALSYVSDRFVASTTLAFPTQTQAGFEPSWVGPNLRIGTTNTAPTIDTPADRTTNIGEATSLQLVGGDAEGVFIFTAADLPDGLSLDAQTGLISGVPTSTGVFTVTVGVDDGSDSATTEFDWQIVSQNVNSPPDVSNPGSQSVTLGESVSLAIAASDTDGDTLTYAATNLPNGLSINASSGLITGTPSATGSFTTTVSVSDGSATDSTTFVWTVSEEPPPLQCEGLSREAESGVLGGAMVVVADAAASAGAFIHAPDGTGSTGDVGSATRAEYCFTVSQAGTYRILTTVGSPNNTADSFFVTVNDLPLDGYLWDVSRDAGFVADFVADRGVQDPVELTLPVGEHTVTVYLREDGTQLDTIALQLVDEEPPPSECAPGLSAEAEDGVLSGAFAVGNDNDASGGAFVHVPQGTGSTGSIGSASTASYCLTVAQTGTYRIRTDVMSPDSTSDSYFVTVDGQPSAGYLWDTRSGAVFAEDYVSDRGGADPVELNLSAGEHEVTFHLREDGSMLDTVALELVNEVVVGDCDGLTREAEDGELFGAFAIGSDANASNGEFVHVPEGTGNTGSVGSSSKAQYCFTVAQAGTYRIEASVASGGSTSDSFFVTVNDEPLNGYLWDVAGGGSFVTDQVSERGGADPVEVSLSAGEHTVTIYLREDGTKLDTVGLSPASGDVGLACDGLTREAEDGVLNGRFAVFDDAGASGGQFIEVPDGSGSTGSSDSGHDATYCFTVLDAGTYRIKTQVFGVDNGSDSFFVTVDDEPLEGYLWDVRKAGDFAEDFVSDRDGADPVEVVLDAGEHIVRVHLREDGTRLDRLELELLP